MNWFLPLCICVWVFQNPWSWICHVGSGNWIGVLWKRSQCSLLLFKKKRKMEIKEEEMNSNRFETMYIYSLIAFIFIFLYLFYVLFILYLAIMYVCAPCMYLLSTDVRRGRWIPCNWSYNYLWAIKICGCWELNFSPRATSALNSWAIYPAPSL